MPLRDHFRPPVDRRHAWPGLHSAWPMHMIQRLNLLMPENYVAEPHAYLGGVAEVVAHGECGLLSPVDDLAAFAANLRTLLLDRARAQAMGARARAIAVERFARDSVVREYESLYLRTLSATPWPFP